MFWNVHTLCTTCVTYACPKLYVTSFPVSVSVQLQLTVPGIGRQHGIGLTLFETIPQENLARCKLHFFGPVFTQPLLLGYHGFQSVSHACCSGFQPRFSPRLTQYHISVVAKTRRTEQPSSGEGLSHRQKRQGKNVGCVWSNGFITITFFLSVTLNSDLWKLVT